MVAVAKRACQRDRDYPGHRRWRPPVIAEAATLPDGQLADGTRLLPAVELAQLDPADEGVPFCWGEAQHPAAGVLAVADPDDVVS